MIKYSDSLMRQIFLFVCMATAYYTTNQLVNLFGFHVPIPISAYQMMIFGFTFIVVGSIADYFVQKNKKKINCLD